MVKHKLRNSRFLKKECLIDLGIKIQIEEFKSLDLILKFLSSICEAKDKVQLKSHLGLVSLEIKLSYNQSAALFYVFGGWLLGCSIYAF